jgi:spermidine synthase
MRTTIMYAAESIVNQRVFISLCFFLSGISALIYEVVWSRMLTTIFGASLYAVATVTAVFLGGLAIGALLAGKFVKVDKTYRFLMYAGFECLVGLFGGVVAPFLLASPALNPIAAALVILVPTLLMGATLPILVGAFVADETIADESTQTLYAANTTGGALGALIAGFWLIPALGLRYSSLVGLLFNLVAAGGAILARNAKPAPEPAAPSKKSANPVPMLAKPLIINSVAFLSGFILLQLEICWTRWFSLILGSSVYAISCVLAIILLSLAVGAWIAKRVLQPLGNGLLLMASAYFLSTTYILITLYAANEIPWSFLSLTQSLSSMGGYSFETSLAARAIVVSLIIAVPAVLLGTVLPLLFGANVEQKSAYVGRIYAINVAGAICGALVTGFFLIPGLSAWAETGIRWTMILSLVVQILLSCWLFMEWSRSFVTDPDTRAIVVGIVIFVSAAVIIDVACFRPEWNRAIASAGASFFTPEDLKKLDKESFLAAVGALEGQDTIRFYREGLNATVTVAQDSRRNITYLKTDGKVEAAVPTDPIQPSQGSDATTHLLLGALPSHLVAGNPLTALVIGYGSGTTSGAILKDPRVNQLTIAELESAVYAADKYFADSTGKPLSQSSRVRALSNDGRYVLQSRPDQYDVIVCQPSDPWVSGASELFTQNFWQLAKSRLKPDGVFAQWLPLYSVRSPEFVRLCKTFADAFPNCCIVLPSRAGECIMLGSASATPFTDEQIRSSISSETSLGNTVRSAAIVDSQGVHRLVDQVRTAPNTDDHNVIEFAAAKAAITPEQNIDENAAIIQHYAKSPGDALSR